MKEIKEREVAASLAASSRAGIESKQPCNRKQMQPQIFCSVGELLSGLSFYQFGSILKLITVISH